MKLNQAEKAAIERLAAHAALKGISANTACPYPFSSPQGLHFKAVHELYSPRFVAGPRQIPISDENTECPELTDAQHRPGSSDFRAYPSRIGDLLHYPDGRVTDLAGNLIPTHVGASQ